jgi:hypothetical protein
MTVHAPARVPETPDDLSLPRVAIRNAGNRGFVFVNNRVRHRTMPEWEKFQVTVKLKNETVTVPTHPISIPNGAYTIWPFNLEMQGVRLKYSTAQLFTKLEGKDETDYVFFAVPGVRADFCFIEGTFASIAGNAHARPMAGSTLLENVAPGLATKIVLRSLSGKQIRILILTREEAENAWKTTIGEQERLLFTPKQFFEDEKHIYMFSDGDPHFSFSLYPGLTSIPSSSARIERVTADHQVGVASFVATLPESKVGMQVSKVHDAQAVDVVNSNKRNAGSGKDSLTAPDAVAFGKLATWTYAPRENARIHVVRSRGHRRSGG